MTEFATGTGSLGAGLWLSVTTSENYAGNYSNVHAELSLRGVNSSTFISSGRGCSIYINGTWYGSSFTWASGGGSRVIMVIDTTIGHDANGYLSFEVAGRIEATGTSGIGGATQIPTGVQSTPRIPKPPLAPGTPSLTSSDPTKISLSWAAPDNMGAGISNYRIYYGTNADLSGAASVDTGNAGTSYTLSGLSPGRTYYVALYAQNSMGFGNRSGIASIKIGIGGRIWDGTAERPLVTAKVWDGTAERDIAVGNLWDGTTERLAV